MLGCHAMHQCFIIYVTLTYFGWFLHFSLFIFYSDMRLTPSEITNILVQEFELMEQLESKFPFDKMKVTVCCQGSFIYFHFLSSRYKWMTYGEAGSARAAIGSGLIYHGIPKVGISEIIICLIFTSFRTFCLQ